MSVRARLPLVESSDDLIRSFTAGAPRSLRFLFPQEELPQETKKWIDLNQKVTSSL
jgi:hypothetical protein